jgi:hypothetical protein
MTAGKSLFSETLSVCGPKVIRHNKIFSVLWAAVIVCGSELKKGSADVK